MGLYRQPDGSWGPYPSNEAGKKYIRDLIHEAMCKPPIIGPVGTPESRRAYADKVRADAEERAKLPPEQLFPEMYSEAFKKQLAEHARVYHEMRKDREARETIADLKRGHSIHLLRPGEAPPTQWLVQDVFEVGTAGAVAAAGGLGKGMMFADLALKVASLTNDDVRPANPNPPMAFGGRVVDGGSVVIIAAEDTTKEFHRRLDRIDPKGKIRDRCDDRLIFLSLADVRLRVEDGVHRNLFREVPHGEVELTQLYNQLLRQLRYEFHDLKLLIIDPLSPLTTIDVDTDSARVSWIMSHLTQLASELGITVIVSHHTRKADTRKPIRNVVDAVATVKGSVQLINGGRFAYVLWEAADGDRIAKMLKEKYEVNRFFRGALGKENNSGNRQEYIFVRDKGTGLLRDRTHLYVMEAQRDDPADPEGTLFRAIRGRAEKGQPFTHQGKNGIYERRTELPKSLKKMGRDRLESMVQEMMESGELVKCSIGASKQVIWLDAPDGPIAMSEAGWSSGALPPEED